MRSDKCGPAGDSWLSRFLSRMVPDKVFGVDISECCERHDLDYDSERGRKASDKAFRSCIKCRLRAAALRTGKRYKWVLAPLVAGWYYVWVRLVGWIYK